MTNSIYYPLSPCSIWGFYLFYFFTFWHHKWIKRLWWRYFHYYTNWRLETFACLKVWGNRESSKRASKCYTFFKLFQSYIYTTMFGKILRVTYHFIMFLIYDKIIFFRHKKNIELLWYIIVYYKVISTKLLILVCRIIYKKLEDNCIYFIK